MDANGDSFGASNILDYNKNSHIVTTTKMESDNVANNLNENLAQCCRTRMAAAPKSFLYEDTDTETALPLQAAFSQHNINSGSSDADDVGLFNDEVVPIEIRADSGLSEDEDVTCEFCSPRLDGGDQKWVKSGEHHDTSWEDQGPLTLEQLDDDALFHIARFLESRTLRFGLSLVCRRFHDLFSIDSYFWKIRYATHIGRKCRCPTLKIPSKFDVADRCLAWDDAQTVWGDPDKTQHFKYSHNVLGGVDAVHLMNKGQLLVSGDRNRSLNVIDLTKYGGEGMTEEEMRKMLVHTDSTSHGGWIWTVASVGSTIMTGSWDTHIRLFDMEKQCKIASDYKCTSAVLSLYAEENGIVAGSFDKRIYSIDRRSGTMQHRVSHSKAVLCVTGNDRFIISGSEDHRICIYDRRAAKLYKVFKLETYPLCLSYSDDQLWFGDKTGTLHLHDGTGDKFQHIGTYNIDHTRKMMGVVNTPGAVFSCACDGVVKVVEPTRNPRVISSIKCHKEVAGLAYSHGVLAGAGDDCISLWLPKHADRNTYLL